MRALRDQVRVQDRVNLVLEPRAMTHDLVAPGHQPTLAFRGNVRRPDLGQNAGREQSRLGELLAFLDQDASALPANQALRERSTEVVNSKTEHKSAERSSMIDPVLKAALVREVNDRVSQYR
jgi:hypothetical protein